jgi:RNA polymerase sigma factor (sigma-70 family)
MDQQQRRETLAEALASLPDRCREVVQLRFQENLSYKEIAARLGVTTDTVKVHLGPRDSGAARSSSPLGMGSRTRGC